MSRLAKAETRQVRPFRRNVLPELAIERKKPTSRDVGFAYNLAVGEFRYRPFKWSGQDSNRRLLCYAAATG